MSFREVREFVECLRSLGFHRVVSISNFKEPNFELTAEIMDWLVTRLNPDVNLPEDIDTDTHRVEFIAQAIEAVGTCTNIRMNARKLYGADNYAVKEMLKVARFLYQACRLGRHEVYGRSKHEVKVLEARAVGNGFNEDLRPMSSLSSEILEAGAKLHALLQVEAMPDTERAYGVRRARQKAVKFLEGISRNLSSDRERSNVERQLTSLLTGQSQSTERLTQMCIDLGEDKQGLEEEVKKRRAELERTSKRLAGLRTVRPAFMDEYEELQEFMDQLYEAYVDRFRNLDYLEHELDILNREEEERIEANEKKLRALQKKLREEEWKLLRGDMDDSGTVGIPHVTEYSRPKSRDRNSREGSRRWSRPHPQDDRPSQGFRQMEENEFGPPASNTDLGVNDFDEPQLVDSRSDGIVSIGSEPEEGLVGSTSTPDLSITDHPHHEDDEDDDIIVESDGEAILSSRGDGSSSGDDIEIIDDSDTEGRTIGMQQQVRSNDSAPLVSPLVEVVIP